MNWATNVLAGAAINSEGVPDLHELALVEHSDPVGKRSRVLVVVSNHDRREAASSQVLA